MMHESPSAAPSSSASAEPSFESKLNQKLSGDSGQPLASDVASHASQSYGTSMSNVRVHTDSESASMAESKGFQAFSYGADVFAKPSAVDTSTQQGSHVMMHELAHVAQTGGQREGGVHAKVEIGTATNANDSLERDADHAADAALQGTSHQVQRAPLMVRGFGATAQRDKNGNRNKNDIVHENQTENAAEKVGFDKADQEMIYSGNWQRDMNQFLIPKMRAAGPIIFTAMDLLHTLHFGFPIGGAGGEGKDAKPKGPAKGDGVKEFGTYDPVEHIDNPGGLTGADVNQQRDGKGEDVDSGAGSKNAGKADDAYAEADARYQAQYDRAKAAGHAMENEGPDGEKKAAFKVDDSGIPIYMQTSRFQLIEDLKKGLTLAAKKAPDAATKKSNRDRALRYSGEALHIMQDYYAHSNFCEVAINILLDEKFNDQGETGKGGSKSFVDIMGLAQINPQLADPKMTKHHLNSYVHKKTNGKAEEGNMKTKGGKEVMATGTFTLEDTAQSIKEKVGLALKNMNPFTEGPKGPSEKTTRLIQWLETNPEYFPFGLAETGTEIGNKLNAVMPVIDGIATGTQKMLGAQGAISAAADKGWGKIKSLWHSATGNDEAAKQDEAQASADAKKHEEDAARRKETVEKLKTELHNVAAHLSGGGSLSSLYKWAYEAGSHVKLSTLARMVPLVGEKLAEVVEKAVKEIKDFIRKRMEAAWGVASQRFIAEFNASVAIALGSSEVSDKTGAQGMTQPTHTDIAKDFDSHQHGTEDKFSVIEEVSEFFHRVGGAKNAGKKLLDIAKDKFNNVMSGKTGIVDGLKQAGSEMSAQVNGPESEEHGHKHQHRHGGAWLASLANGLATQSSEAILAVFKSGVDKGQAGQSNEAEKASVEKVVMTWYAHPADCKGLWQSNFMGMLQGDSVDAQAIKKELARRIALPPQQQAPNDEATIDHHDRHGDEDHGDADHGKDSKWLPHDERGPHKDPEDEDHDGDDHKHHHH